MYGSSLAEVIALIPGLPMPDEDTSLEGVNRCYFALLKQHGMGEMDRRAFQARLLRERRVITDSCRDWNRASYYAAIAELETMPTLTPDLDMPALARRMWSQAENNAPHWVRHDLPNGTRVAVRFRREHRELAIRRGEPLTSATLGDWTAEQIGLRRAFGLDSAKAVPGVVDGCPMTTFEGSVRAERSA